MSAALAVARALAAPGGPASLLPARLRGAWLRRVVALLLRRNGLDALLDELAAPRGRPHRRRPPPAGTVAGLRRLPATCFHRALAGYAILRRAGADVTFVVGVRREEGELVAHAWIEENGAAVGEPEDPRARFTVAYVHPPLPRPAPSEEGDRPMESRRPSPEVVLTRLPDGTGVLLHLGTKFYYTLNRTGVVAWEVAARAQAVDPDAILDEIAARFAGVDRGQARADVDGLLRELEAEGLLASGP